MFADIVLLMGFVERARHACRLVEPARAVGHGIAEQSADPPCDVDARASELREGDDLDGAHAPAWLLPYGAYAHEVEELSDALSVTAHV